jgi:hypothetical protein
MAVEEPMRAPDQEKVAAIRVRREALYQAITGLEDALASPIGDAHKWRLRVAMAVDHAVARIAEHIKQTEADGGLLDEVMVDQPRLANRVVRMRADHEEMEKMADALRLAVAGVGDDDVADRADDIRKQAVELLGQLSRHRQRGSDLIYEAYQVDLGTHG